MTKSELKDRIAKLGKTWGDIKAGDKKEEEVTRVEVVDKNGRAYVNMNAKNVKLSYQDDGRTLKVFID